MKPEDKAKVQQALEAMQFALHVGFDESSESQIKKGDKAGQQHRAAITALRQLLEQPEQGEVVVKSNGHVSPLLTHMMNNRTKAATQPEPVQPEQVCPHGADSDCKECQEAAQPTDLNFTCKLVQARLATRWGYAKAEPAAWVGLTTTERKEIERQSVYVEGAIRMTEAKLREKNGGAA